MGLTLLSYFLDFFAAIVLFMKYGEAGREYAEMTLMAFLVVFVGTNIYWVGQIILLKFKFPPYISSYLINALISAGQNVQKKMKYWNEKAHEKMGRRARRLAAGGKAGGQRGGDTDMQPQAAQP